ncbi:hypothetical protein YB2330_005569 [Saitoella coloradoensis]
MNDVEMIDEKRSTIVVKGIPQLDLESWIQNYSGNTQILRLLFIAERCPELAVDALRAAITLIKEKTLDVRRYIDAVEHLQRISPDAAEAKLDDQWIEQTSRKARSQTEKLESELKSYRNNLIKESIRMGHDDLGKHYYNIGDLSSALTSYSRIRDYCTTPAHILSMCLDVIRVSIELRNFNHTQAYVIKAQGLANSPEKAEVSPILQASNALVSLDVGAYQDVATTLLNVSPYLGTQYNHIIAPQDIATYATLCALATFSRQQLRSSLLDSPSFKPFLEYTPHLLTAAEAFYGSKYSTCFDILEKYKNDFLLDIYLSEHAEKLYKAIRQRALTQFFLPFQKVSLGKMASVFATSVEALEDELAGLIQQGVIDGRLDTQDKLLVAKQKHHRTWLFEKTRSMATNYETTAKLLLTHVKLVRAGLDVKQGKSQMQQEQVDSGDPEPMIEDDGAF